MRENNWYIIYFYESKDRWFWNKYQIKSVRWVSIEKNKLMRNRYQLIDDNKNKQENSKSSDEKSE